ncbi:MAG TPA: hypothetical protein VL987_12200 [Cellvibrio sp.]|nr:hypothetical protein [Cellvibrio sp.]
MLTIVCAGTIELTAEGAATCSSGWMTQTVVVPFDPSAIDPSIVAAMFGAGFLLFFTPWAAAFGFSKLLQAIRSF